MHTPAPARTLVLLVNQAWVALRFRTRLMSHLRQAGWRVVVIADMTKDREELKTYCDDVVHVGMTATKISPVADVKTLLDYWRVLRAARPAAVLSFTIKPNIYGSLACRLLGIPILNNITGMGTVDKSGALVARLVRGLYRVAFARSAWVFFQNSEDARQMTGDGLVRQDGWSLLPGSGVDTSKYLPTATSNQGVPVRFCMLARLLQDKGVADYADAARRMKALRPDARFDLWGILDSNDARCVTAAEVQQWQDEGLLQFRGEARDANEAFESADVVVLPTRFREGMPRSLLEAASKGLPVITTDVPGCREATVHGQTGLICKPRDAESLAQAMAAMVDLGAARRAAMGTAGRQRVLARFDESEVLNAYEERLRAILQPGSALPARA